MVMDMKLQMVDLHGQYLKIKKENIHLLSSWQGLTAVNK